MDKMDEEIDEEIDNETDWTWPAEAKALKKGMTDAEKVGMMERMDGMSRIERKLFFQQLRTEHWDKFGTIPKDFLEVN